MDEQLMWDEMMEANKAEMLEAEYRAMEECGALDKVQKEIDWSIATACDEWAYRQ